MLRSSHIFTYSVSFLTMISILIFKLGIARAEPEYKIRGSKSSLISFAQSRSTSTATKIFYASDTESWIALWNSVNKGAPLPEVDFTKYIVLGVRQGFPSSRYTIEITKVSRVVPIDESVSSDPMEVIIKLEVLKPGRTCNALTIFTTAYSFVRLPISFLPKLADSEEPNLQSISIDKTEKTFTCSQDKSIGIIN